MDGAPTRASDGISGARRESSRRGSDLASLIRHRAGRCSSRKAMPVASNEEVSNSGEPRERWSHEEVPEESQAERILHAQDCTECSMSPECLTTPEEPGSASHIAVCEVELFQIKPLPGLRLGEHTKGVLEAGHPCRAEGAVAVVHEHRLVLRHAAHCSGGPTFALSNDHSNATARIRELLRLQLSDERLATANAECSRRILVTQKRPGSRGRTRAPAVGTKMRVRSATAIVARRMLSPAAALGDPYPPLCGDYGHRFQSRARGRPRCVERRPA
jgi:hypothetical protein